MSRYLVFFILISCSHPKDKFINDFGIFINEVEANYKSFDDVEWEVTQINFINFKDEFEEIKQQMDEYEIDQVGLRLKDLTDFVRDQYNIDESVSGSVITGVKNNSPASNAGLSVGNVISQVSQKKITSAKQAKQIFDNAVKRNMDSVLVQIYQNGFPRFIPLKLK